MLKSARANTWRCATLPPNNMANLPVIQALWIGRPLSQLEKLCVRSFLYHGHEFHLYVYDDVQGIPDGATVKDANEILPESAVFRLKKTGELGPFSDWFRYALLAKHGGFWADMDMVCLKPFDFPEEIVFGAANGTFRVSTLKFPKGHECVVALEDSCRNYGKEMPWDEDADKERKRKIRRRGEERGDAKFLQFGSTPVFTLAARHFGLEKYAKSYICFYPVTVTHAPAVVQFFDSSHAGVRLSEDSYAFHVGNSSTARLPNFDLNANFHPGSLYEQMKAKYGVAPVPNAPNMNLDAYAAHKISTAHEASLAAHLKKRRLKQQSAIAGILCAISFLLGYML